MRKRIDLTNQTFRGVFKAVKYSHKNKQGKPMWECECLICGKFPHIVSTSNLTHGRANSCGCLPRHKDLTGKVFNGIKVVSFSKIRHKLAYWNVDCHCGNKFRVCGRSLTSGNTKSCGCKFISGSKHSNYKKELPISSAYMAGIRSRSRKRGFTWDVNNDYLIEIFTEQGGKCALSGEEIFLIKRYEDLRSNKASVDRINSKEGYIKGNVQWVHKDVNAMKWDFSEKEFVDWCRKVAEYNK